MLVRFELTIDNQTPEVIVIPSPEDDPPLYPLCESADVHPLLRKFEFGEDMEVLFDSSLGSALKNIMAEAICCGEIAPSSIMDTTMRNLQAGDLDNGLGTLLQPDVDRIVAIAKPSPFGQGNETVFDDNVRKGLELVASQFSIAHEDELLRGIRQQIQQKLFPLLPGGPEAVTLKRYKMAIYQEGGHFQFHRDSLHADNHQATLLLEVRSAHEGGKFVIDHYSRGAKKIEVSKDYYGKPRYAALFEMSFDEGGNVSTPLKWMAFYTDALHKVERVISGTRIVIQYDVYIDTNMPVVGGDSNETPAYSDFYPLNKFESYRYPCIPHGALQKVLRELDKLITMHGTENVAIPLFHCYSAVTIKREFLKVFDRLLFDAIVEENKYVLGLSPVVAKAKSDDRGRYFREDFSFKFTDPMDVSHYWDANEKDIRSMTIGKDHDLNSRDCMYVFSQREEAWQIEYSENCEWLGNEAEPGRLKYFLGVMVVGLK